MNYIYDILVNYKKEVYDVYDWNKEDQILNLRKIPIIKVEEKVLYDLMYKKVVVDDSFLEMIHNKTDAFHQIHFQVLSYSAVFTDGKMAFTIKFEHKKNEYISFLLFDEEEEVLDLAKKMDVMKLSYKVCGKRNFSLKTRKEVKKIEYIQKNLKKISEEELMYLYFDCFNKKDGLHKKLEIKNHLDDRLFLDHVYDFFKLTSKRVNENGYLK